MSQQPPSDDSVGDMRQPDEVPVQGGFTRPEPSPRPNPFAGPPIFPKPKPEELPPENKRWWTWAAWLFTLFAIPPLSGGLTGLAMSVGGGGGGTSIGTAVFELVLGVALGVGAAYFFTANNRSVNAWKRRQASNSR